MQILFRPAKLWLGNILNAIAVQFPRSPERFGKFRDEVTTRMLATLGLEEWQVRDPEPGSRPLAGKFRDRLLKTIEHHGVSREVHLIEISETGDRVPAGMSCRPRW